MIREARSDEAESLAAIQRDASLAANAHIFPPEQYPFPDEAVREEWQKSLSGETVEVHVAEVEGLPAGVVTIDGEFLGQLYVLPEYQGDGVGSALHDHALERLRAGGNVRARLWCLEENLNARRFYERRGWELTEETRVVPFPPNPIDVQYAKSL